MKITMKKLMLAAAFGMALMSCSHAASGRLSEADLREFYCESVSYEDTDNCVYVPIEEKE